MKPLRADARRNRARLLEVAEAVFAAKGTGASTEEVAREAGVGIGTVFRHFPTKEALLEAVFYVRLRRLADDAEAGAAADDPAEAFFGFFTGFVDQVATHKALIDALVEAGVDVQDGSSGIKRDFHRALDTLLRRAQAAGAVRADVGVPEVIALLVGASRAADHVGADPTLRARTVALVLDGLRP